MAIPPKTWDISLQGAICKLFSQKHFLTLSKVYQQNVKNCSFDVMSSMQCVAEIIRLAEEKSFVHVLSKDTKPLVLRAR